MLVHLLIPTLVLLGVFIGLPPVAPELPPEVRDLGPLPPPDEQKLALPPFVDPDYQTSWRK